MIELRTGLPGNGKTLSTIQDLAKLLKTFDKPGAESRPVFVHNVKDLSLPHAPFPFAEHTDKAGRTVRIPDWSQVPDGSLCIIDECQDFFPPRSAQSQAPEHIAWLNTHRHRGVDLILITQHPRLIDGAVRALVGKHKHYRRVFGMNRSIVYEWDGCSDSLAGMKNATTTYWSFPKDAYKWYKSAEVHTKQRFRLPLWLLIPVLGLALGAYFVPQAYSVIKYGSKGELPSAHEKPASVDLGTLPGHPGIPSSQPVHRAPAPPPPPSAPPLPQYVGCISSEKECSCLMRSGALVRGLDLCRQSSREFGYLVHVSMEPGQRPAAIASQAVEVLSD